MKKLCSFERERDKETVVAIAEEKCNYHPLDNVIRH